jgi:hypothetical protein
MVVPYVGKVLFEYYPPIRDMVFSMLKETPDLWSNLDQWYLLAPGFILPPFPDISYPPAYVRNYVDFHSAMKVYVLFADADACPMFFSGECQDSANAFQNAWNSFVADKSADSKLTRFIRADKDACACNCPDCPLDCSCTCDYTPMIKLYDRDNGIFSHPPIQKGGSLVPVEKWTRL